MKPQKWGRTPFFSFGFALAVCALAACAPGQHAYQPSVGQAGKDVVWVPTPQALVDRMLDMAKLRPQDYLIDLGSGDGRTVITAARRGAQAHGIEYNAEMVELSRRNAEQAGVGARAQFSREDLFQADFSKASVITMFLLPSINLKLRPRLLALKPGTRIVSNTFTMGDWEPDELARLDRGHGCETSWCTALLWIVPARVGGTHRMRAGELTLKQTYQALSGTLRSAGKTLPVEGKVLGEEVFLNAGGRALYGKMNGTRLVIE